MNGVLVLNKRKDVTSRDEVNELIHIFNTNHIGHTGTLDPIATGVLVITIGKYTKLNSYLVATKKEYIAEMVLGLDTDTLDITGNILHKEDAAIEEEKIKEVISSYKGTYLQEVPLYSAIKVNGKKLYEYARNGESVVLPKRNVSIYSIDILSIKDNIIKFKVCVSKGTYIRSLIRDIGASLGTYGCMKSLIRTKQGDFSVEDSYTIEDIKNGNFKLLKFEDVLDLDVIENFNIKDISNGVKVDGNISDKEFILFKNVALYKKDNNYYRMFIKL